jgi:hypothetical protein
MSHIVLKRGEDLRQVSRKMEDSSMSFSLKIEKVRDMFSPKIQDNFSPKWEKNLIRDHSE